MNRSTSSLRIGDEVIKRGPPMSEKPTYEELEQEVKELEKEAVKYKLAEEARREKTEKLNATLCSIGDHMSMMNKDLDII